jgi:hypothetical protein
VSRQPGDDQALPDSEAKDPCLQAVEEGRMGSAPNRQDCQGNITASIHELQDRRDFLDTTALTTCRPLETPVADSLQYWIHSWTQCSLKRVLPLVLFGFTANCSVWLISVVLLFEGNFRPLLNQVGCLSNTKTRAPHHRQRSELGDAILVQAGNWNEEPKMTPNL